MTLDPAFLPHDHALCSAAAVASAQRIAAKTGLRLTPIRRRVLEILAQSHRPLGAYAVLAQLTSEGHPRQPPIAYRALEFLCANGLAHRINRLNAFTACRAPGRNHVASFLICKACGRVAEAAAPTAMRAVERAVEDMAGNTGFIADPVGVEAVGLCPCCAAGPKPASGQVDP